MVLKAEKPLHDFIRYREPCVRFTLLNVLEILSSKRLRDFVEEFLNSHPAFPSFRQMGAKNLAKNVKALEKKLLLRKGDQEEPEEQEDEAA